MRTRVTERSGRDDRGRRLRGDAGSSLMLMPAAVLVVLVLGAIAADLSQLHNAKRGLIGVANSVANDAVTYGLDVSSLRGGSADEFPLDESRVNTAIAASLREHASPTRRYQLVDTDIDRVNRTVTVTLAGPVDWIFARALPGIGDDPVVQATGIAVAQQG